MIYNNFDLTTVLSCIIGVRIPKQGSEQMKKYSINNTTGEILSDLRRNKGLTQKELARIFNVSEGTIAHYEQGITIPNVEILSKFADYFEVTVDYLLGRCLCKVEYTKLNTQLNSNMTLGDMVNIVSSLSKEKKHYLYQTIVMLSATNPNQNK